MVLLAAVALAVGCGVVELGNPRQIVSRAIQAQGRLKSVHMEMDTDLEFKGATSNLGDASNFYRGEGDFEKPDKSKMTIKSAAGKTEVITIGDTAYVKMPGSEIWTQRDVSDYLATGVSPNDVTNYLKYTKDLKLLDRDDDMYHLSFNLDMGRYARVAGVPGVDPAVFKGMEARMEVWVLKDSFRVKKAKMDFAGDLTKVGAGRLVMSMEVEFSDFDKPVKIEAPF
ncbi:MAG: hypothetical protein JJE48_04160 [Actinobacteria bacterium]|nr:hypothetical protein [Actinomycetota bacterium]